MQFVDFAWLSISAAAAKGINALAGGGTLLTFPALMGVLSQQSGVAHQAAVFANGTSTMALAPASLGGDRLCLGPENPVAAGTSNDGHLDYCWFRCSTDLPNCVRYFVIVVGFSLAVYYFWLRWS